MLSAFLLIIISYVTLSAIVSSALTDNSFFGAFQNFQ